MPVIEVTGHAVEYHQWGGPSGSSPELVLIHSLLTDASVFEGSAPVLARSRRVTTINLPGYGASAARPLETIAGYAAFLREAAHFTLLGESVLPHLYQTGAGVRTPLRVWSAASSTGEEPYTLAMLLDQWGRSRRPFEYSILGTDISTSVLEQARLGAYQERAIAALPESWRQSYLLRARGSSAPAPYRINAALRARVQFGYLNLMDDDYRLPDRYHIIFCRNVLIYFNRPTQAAVISKLIERLVPGGYLFVGHSESLQGSDFPLATLVPSVYRHLPAWQSGEMAIRRAS